VSGVQLPPPRVALRHAAVRSALLLVLAGPAWVAWAGKAADAPVRLRLLALALAVVAALAWDDRVHGLTAATPVGLPAVRRGRALVVGCLLLLTYALGLRAVPEGTDVPAAAVLLQACGLAALLLALVAWLGRDGDVVLAVPLPAAMLLVVLMYRLPTAVAMLRAEANTPAWAAERTRWWVVLAFSAALVAWWGRDPAARRYFWRA